MPRPATTTTPARYQSIYERLFPSGSWFGRNGNEGLETFPDQCTGFSKMVKTQSASRLLSLPFDVRQLIYKEIIGNSVIHCITTDKPTKMSSKFWKCPNPARCTCQYRIHDISARTKKEKAYLLWHVAKKLPNDAHFLPIAFLQTCQMVYSEAAELLYTSNLFRIYDVWTLVEMSRSINDIRFNQIRALSLFFYFGADGYIPGTYERHWGVVGQKSTTDTVWAKAWDDLAEHFAHIRELEIVIQIRNLKHLLEVDETRWIQPLLNIQRLKLKNLTIKIIGNEESLSDRPLAARALEQRLEEILIKDPAETITTISSSTIGEG